MDRNTTRKRRGRRNLGDFEEIEKKGDERKRNRILCCPGTSIFFQGWFCPGDSVASQFKDGICSICSMINEAKCIFFRKYSYKTKKIIYLNSWHTLLFNYTKQTLLINITHNIYVKINWRRFISEETETHNVKVMSIDSNCRIERSYIRDTDKMINQAATMPRLNWRPY